MSTEQIHEEMVQVMRRGGGLAMVARAVDSLNFTLANHAAWTDERFENVDRRFDQVDLTLAGLTVGQAQIVGELQRMSARMDRVLSLAIRDEMRVDEIDE